MIKAAVTIGCAAILAGFICMLPAPRVEAGTPQAAPPAVAVAAALQPAKAADPRTSDCAQRAWPYYDHGCLAGEPRKVRLVTTDRLN